MKEAVCTMTNEVKSYFTKINREKNSNNIGKIDLSEEIEENLSINSLFNIDQETSDNEEKMSTLRIKAQDELKKYAANSLTNLEPSKNSEVSFKIELMDPNMKPIICNETNRSQYERQSQASSSRTVSSVDNSTNFKIYSAVT